MKRMSEGGMKLSDVRYERGVIRRSRVGNPANMVEFWIMGMVR